MAYSWEEEKRGGGMSSTGGAKFESAREVYRKPEPEPVSRSSRRSDGGSPPSRRVMREDSLSSRGGCPGKPGETPRPIGLTISTDSTHPIGVVCDNTGSMGEWPGMIKIKLALLGKEVERYAPRYAISFAFVGDTRCDKYGLQFRNFDCGPALEQHLDKLYVEGQGGDEAESYGVAAYYYLHHCDIPNAVKPILVFILDAPDHGDIIPSEVREYIGDIINTSLRTSEVFKELMKKFSVYIISAHGKSKDYWVPIVGAQRFIPIEEYGDIVEVLIGIVAGEFGEFEDFEMRSSARHSDKPDRVSRVGKSLRSVKETSEKMGSSAGIKADSPILEEKSMKSRKLA